VTDTQTLRQQIHEANRAVHKVEVSYYELFHPEVYSKHEQKRITGTLQKAGNLVVNNGKRALDFGAGTGNLTEKLLTMGYEVTAVDISAEMCELLKKKHRTYLDAAKLAVVNAPIEDVSFEAGKFDLVTCYSVLHHLPDYEAALRQLCGFLKQGGVIYLDHEASPYYWKMEPTMLAELIKAVYFHSNPILNSIYFQMVGFKVPTLDYTLSDYWHKKEHSMDHQKIAGIFKKEKFSSAKRTDYYLTGSWIYNPVFSVYKHVCRPEMSYWIAKK
jgi:ubiquinone/menaquinone biosynthesis C-methylase UbiE